MIIYPIFSLLYATMLFTQPTNTTPSSLMPQFPPPPNSSSTTIKTPHKSHHTSTTTKIKTWYHRTGFLKLPPLIFTCHSTLLRQQHHQFTLVSFPSHHYARPRVNVCHFVGIWFSNLVCLIHGWENFISISYKILVSILFWFKIWGFGGGNGGSGKLRFKLWGFCCVGGSHGIIIFGSCSRSHLWD